MPKEMYDYLKKIGKEKSNIIILILFWTQLIMCLNIYIFKKSYYLIHLILYMLIVISFLFFKDFVDVKTKKKQFKFFKISFVIFCIASIAHFFLFISSHFNNIEMANSFFRINYLVNIATLLIILYYSMQDETKKMLDNIYENSIYTKLKLVKEELKPGDVILCRDKDTDEPVILPYKDRFLHMLILGPTGSGKTSQTIIPLIHQDIQNKDCGITVIEPKGDLAEKIYAMAKYYGRPVIYFNPILPNCPYFNPLYGKEEDVIENMATTFKMLNPDSPQFFQDMNEQLLRNSLKVLKRLYGNNATLVDLARLIQNSGGAGRKIVTQFSRLSAETEEIAKENADIASWFLNDYFNEKSKTYEHCSGLRSQVAKITSNKYLRRVLNPPEGRNDIDFDKHLAEGGVITISTAQGDLRDLGRYLGYFIILQFQSAVFRRPGNENTRRPHFLYIDEFQEFSNPGFGIMLTQGRSYRVASHLATQNRALMAMGGGKDGKNFVELVSTNARNVVIYPGGNAIDAKYYSQQFGEIIEEITQKSISRSKFSLFGGGKKGVSETIRKDKKLKARFTPSDIIYRPFGEITYCIVKNNSIQPPGVGKIEYIPKELNDILDKMVEEYKAQFEKENKDNIIQLKKEVEHEIELSKGEIPDIVSTITSKQTSNIIIEKEEAKKEIDKEIKLEINKNSNKPDANKNEPDFSFFEEDDDDFNESDNEEMDIKKIIAEEEFKKEKENQTILIEKNPLEEDEDDVEKTTKDFIFDENIDDLL